MNRNQDNLNKKIEETKNNFEKMFGGSCSYHEEDSWGRKDGVFTIKPGSADEKNIKILTNLEKSLGSGQPVNFQIENSEGKLIEVSKEEFAKWMENEKNVKTPPKESLVYGAKGDIDGTEIYVERKSKEGFFKESYYEPRSEEEKKQIIERNRKRREQEKSQTETSPNSDKKDQATEKETNQQDFSQNLDNKESAEKKDKLTANQQSSLQDKDNNHQNIYYGVGLISLVLLVISMVVVWMKKKR